MSSPTTGPLHQGTLLNFHSPAVISVIAVAVIALVALGFIFVPPFGPGPSASGEASASPTPTLTATAEPTPTAPPPTATAVPTATPLPTPAPPAPWTGLVWSDPLTPSFTVHLTDLVPWDDGYVAVGALETDGGPAARIFTSPDGLNWTVAYDPGVYQWPRRLVVRGDELLAFGEQVSPALPPGSVAGAPPVTNIWHSTDGKDWSLLGQMPTIGIGSHQSAGWDESQYPIETGLIDVASGPGGLVAIGNAFAGDELAPVLLHSTDGRSWSQVSLPDGLTSALLNEVVLFDDAFVLVGATDVGADPSTAVPAAWLSTDGTSWTSRTVSVDGLPLLGRGTEVGAVAAGADGLVGWMGRREMTAGGPRFLGWWTSADGRTWQPKDMDVYLPSYTGHVADDGVRMVSLPRTFHEDTGELSPIDTAWVSTDGVTWTELRLSADMADPLEAFWVVPDGVIYAGEQSFRFGQAVIGE